MSCPFPLPAVWSTYLAFLLLLPPPRKLPSRLSPPMVRAGVGARGRVGAGYV